MNEVINAIIEQVPQWRGLKSKVTELGGLTNKNYKVDIHDTSFVLRMGGKGTKLLGIDRKNEFEIAAIAAKVGLGAKIIWADEEQDFLMTEFIQGRQITEERAVQPDTLKQIIDAIKTYHNGPKFSGHFSAFETVRNYYQLARQYQVNFPATISEALNIMDSIEQTLQPHVEIVPCHNDLLAANFIDDGQNIRLIDWEYAGMGDRFFDLGNFAVNQSLDAQASQLLLELYFGEVRDIDMAYLKLMRLASDMRESMWGFLQSGISDKDFDYLDYGNTHLNRFLEHWDDSLLAGF